MRRKLKVAVTMELAWPFKRHFEIFEGIRDFAAENGGWDLEIENYPHLEMARGKKYDGIIGRIRKNCLSAAGLASVPVVNVWIDSPVAGMVPGVNVDYLAAGRLAAEHLIIRGFQRLAHIGFKGSKASKRHYEGMLEVAQKCGFSCSSYMIPTNFAEKEEMWEKFVDYITEAQSQWEAPQGLVFSFDEISHAVSAICAANGWKIPEQMAVIGAGNEPLICNAGSPSLSSVDMGFRRCGYEAALLLDHLMKGGKSPDAILYVPPKELVLRRSSDAYAVNDPAMARALSYMAHNTHLKISVNDIAMAAGIGRQSLEQRFRKLLQRTVNEELIRLRISKMKRLLVEGEKTVGEISEIAGFSTTANMHVMFKRHTGLTPISYREKYNPRDLQK